MYPALDNLTILIHVTRGQNIVADGWAWASNPHPHLTPHPTPFPTQTHTQQGRIHGHQLRTGGQGRKCAFSHFSTRSPLRTNRRADKASYRVASPRLKSGTRPDTRPSVADGWAGAEMQVFPLFDSITSTDRPTDQPTNQPTNQRTKPLIEMRGRI